MSLHIMTSRRLAVSLLLAAVLAAGAIAFWTPLHTLVFGRPRGAGSILVSGNIEAHQSVLSFNGVEAPITYLPFDEGMTVKAGAVLARVDDRLYQQQLQMDLAAQAVAREQIAVSQSSLAAARKTVASDQLELLEKNASRHAMRRWSNPVMSHARLSTWLRPQPAYPPPHWHGTWPWQGWQPTTSISPRQTSRMRKPGWHRTT
ncbi:MAG TPA: hypothetical protein VNE18_01820 [Rhodanobacter sp.]|nr:hypothetical protein [Rhodanobacter sp.]